MEPWVVAIITTATGGTFALIGGWLGTRWGKRTEHEQWLRNQKLLEYNQFVRLYREGQKFLIESAHGHKHSDDKARDVAFNLATAQLSFFTSEDVALAEKEMSEWVTDTVLKVTDRSKPQSADYIAGLRMTEERLLVNLLTAMSNDLERK